MSSGGDDVTSDSCPTSPTRAVFGGDVIDGTGAWAGTEKYLKSKVLNACSVRNVTCIFV